MPGYERVQALLRETIHILQGPATPKPSAAPPADDELIEFSGIISRPNYREVKGILDFTTGTRVRGNNDRRQWVNSQPWGNIETWALENPTLRIKVNSTGFWRQGD